MSEPKPNADRNDAGLRRIARHHRGQRAPPDHSDQKRNRDGPDQEPAGEVEQRDDDERCGLVVETGEQVFDLQFAAAIERACADEYAGAQHRVQKRRRDLPEERDEREAEHDGDEQQGDHEPDPGRVAEQRPACAPPFHAVAGADGPAVGGRAVAGGRLDAGPRCRSDDVHNRGDSLAQMCTTLPRLPIVATPDRGHQPAVGHAARPARRRSVRSGPGIFRGADGWPTPVPGRRAWG